MRIRKTNVVILLAVLLFASAYSVMNVEAGPGKLVHNPWNPPGVVLGITKDDISLNNKVDLCQPVPTDDTSNGVKWDWCNSDFSFSLQQFDKNSAQYFPLNDLPSGGNSGRISKSEMVIAVVNILDNDPAEGWVQYSWYEKGGNVDGTDKKMVQTEKLPVSACGGYPHIGGECGIYGTVQHYAYVGHFSGEIESGGYYFVLIDTKWGEARIDFEAITPDDHITNPGDGVSTVVTPVPTVQTNVQTQAVSLNTPVATPVVPVSRGISYDTGHWVGSSLESFLSGMAHGFWNGIFG